VADQDVNIVGVNGQQVPEWATEQTLENILDQVSDLVKITKQQRDVLKKGIKSGGTGSSPSGGESKEEKEKNKKTKEASNLLGQLSTDLAETHSGFEKLPRPMKKYLDNLKKTNKTGFLMIAGFGAIINQATKAAVSMGEQVSTLRDLASSGVQLEGSFMEMSRGLAEVGMTVAEFGEMTGKYSRVIGMQGFQAVSRLSSAVNEAEGGFAKWGMTQKEGIEIAAELLDQQRRAGIFRNINEQREGKRIEDVMNRLTAYSKVLNVSREEMLENRKALMNDAEVRFRMSQMTEEERVRMQRGLGGTFDALSALGDDFDWVANLMKEAAVFQINEQSAAWQELASAGLTPLANELADLADQAKDTGVPLAMEDILAVINKYGGDKGLLESLFQSTSGAAREYATKLGNASITAEEAEDQIARNRERRTEAEDQAVDANVQRMTALQNELNQFTAAIEHVRNKLFYDLIGAEAGKGITGVTEALDSMTKKLLEFSDSNAVSNFRTQVLENPVLAVGGLIAAFAALKAASLATSAAMTKLGPGMAGLLTKLGRGLGVVGAAGAAGAAGYAVGTLINKLPEIFGFDSISTNIVDGLDRLMGNTGEEHVGALPMQDGVVTDAYLESMSPDQRQMVLRARERRAARARDDAAAAQESNATASPASTTDSSTAEAATPTMSPAEIASLSVGERQAYLLAELLRTNKRIARGITGDSFA
jgi:hypothetical protein